MLVRITKERQHEFQCLKYSANRRTGITPDTHVRIQHVSRLRSERVIAAIPLDELCHASLDRRGWFETDVADQIVDIGIRRGDVAGLHRKEILLSLFAEAFLQRFDQVQQLDRLVNQRDLVAGGDVAVFAEGGIAPVGQRLPFKTGAFSLAIRTGCPVVPVAIRGSDRLLPPNGHLLVRSGVVIVEFLDVVDTTGLTLDDRHAVRDHVCDLVSEAVLAVG